MEKKGTTLDNNKREYLYYLLNFEFIINNSNIYESLRKLLYKGCDYDEDVMIKTITSLKPLSYNDNVLTFKQFFRERKLEIILDK